MRHAATFVTALALSSGPFAARAIAGPPYLTDDPEPVELRHWEVYAASQWFVTRGAADGTAPHVEVNYGALPELQLHVIVPAALAVKSGEPTRYGLGDIELGVKYRFLQRGLWKNVTLGTEAFLNVPLRRGSPELRINLGLVVDFSARQHLLLSGGPALGAEAGGQGCCAYQLTI